MTSSPTLTERNIQKPNAYLLDSRPEQNSLVTYRTLQSLYVGVWLVNTLTSTAPIGSPIICMWSPADICEQWERNLSFGSADVRGTGTRDESLRTFAWEVTRYPAVRNFDQSFFLEIARLIPLKTQDICLEISSDCKYCLGLKAEATVVRGYRVKSQCFRHKKYSSSHTLSQFPYPQKLSTKPHQSS